MARDRRLVAAVVPTERGWEDGRSGLDGAERARRADGGFDRLPVAADQSARRPHRGALRPRGRSDRSSRRALRASPRAARRALTLAATGAVSRRAPEASDGGILRRAARAA